MLSNKALTVSLCISQWTARKYDRAASYTVEAMANAFDAGRYNKLLIARSALSGVQKLAGKLRDFHYKNTLPWGDQGERLLPTENYFNYMEQLSTLQGNYEEAVREFIINYVSSIEEARQRLGTLFQIRDYPPAATLQEKFGVKATFLPVQDTDFRVALEAEELQELKIKAEQEITQRMQEARSYCFSRIKEHLLHIKERMGGVDRVFKNSLFNSLKETVELLPRFNITYDPVLHDITEDLKQLCVSPQLIREKPSERERVGALAAYILFKYKSHL